MGEAATAIQPTTASGAPPPAAPPAASPPPAASATLTLAPEWTSGLKDDGIKNAVSRFKSVEDLATSYVNLEKMKGVPEDKLLRLPDKWDSPEAKAVWEKLGTPKEAKDYELPKSEQFQDDKFAEWAAGAFHQNNLTKTQAQGVVKAWNDYAASIQKAQAEAYANKIKQADETLKTEWGANYDKNLNLAKQGVKVLGLDEKTLDQLEMLQGRDVLFKTLSTLGASVGESNFVSGGAAPAAMSAEDAQKKIKSLTQDKKFGKQMSKGNSEAIGEWNRLHEIAYPGTKPIG